MYVGCGMPRMLFFLLLSTVFNTGFLPHIAEMNAIKEGALAAQSFHCHLGMIITDAKLVEKFKLFKKPTNFDAHLVSAITDTISNSTDAFINLFPREANSMAHLLATKELSSQSNIVF